MRSIFRALFRRRRVERELDAELQFHLDQDIAERVAAGQSAEDARAEALRAFGGVASVKDACRESLGLRLADALRQDLRHTGRALLKQRGFTLVVVASLGLGIGANTAIFQLINAVRLRTLPVSNPHELAAVRIDGGNRGLGTGNGFNSDLTYPLWLQVKEHQTAFSGVFAWGATQLPIGSGASTEVVDGLFVSGDLFPVLRLSPARGRLFAGPDDHPGCGSSSAVLSYAYWQRRFGGDETIVGRTLPLADHPATIIGVAPKGFFGLEVGKTFDVALPLCSEAAWGNASARRDIWWLAVWGRRKPDWTVARASAHLTTLSPAMFDETTPPGHSRVADRIYRSFRLVATPAGNGSSRLREHYDAALWLLLAMTATVLLVACVNLANLMLARATAKQREIAVRIAIGASRGRVLFQSLLEGVVLAVVGGAVGVVLSGVLSRGLVALLDTDMEPVLIDVTADWRVLAFTSTVAVVACLLFAFMPALRSIRVNPTAAIAAGGRSVTGARESFSIHRMLVASQIALTLVLLAGSLLFVRSFRNLVTLDAGFREHDIVFMTINYASRRLPPEQRNAYAEQLLEEIRSAPGVRSAALTTHLPLDGSSWTLGIHVPNAQGEEVGDSKFTYVSPHYFDTMGAALVSGRDFNDFDRATSQRVAIVNETFVRRYVRVPNPLGVQLRTVAEPGNPATVYEIVGVARDTKYRSLREGIPAMAFVPITQNPDDRPRALAAIESGTTPDDLVHRLDVQFRTAHPDLRFRFNIFERQIRNGLSRERLMAWLAGFFGVVAAALAVVGLYGLISYIVQRRVHEIGIRIALGATSSNVIGLVLSQSAVLVAIGLAAGIPASLVAARSAESLLFGLSPHDATTILTASGLLAAIAACASLAPAWRAARIEPTRALREE